MASWKNPPRLFIPGPVQVNPDVLEQLSRPTLGHRLKEYADLHGEIARALAAFRDDVAAGDFPAPEHAVEMADEEWTTFLKEVAG